MSPHFSMTVGQLKHHPRKPWSQFSLLVITLKYLQLALHQPVSPRTPRLANTTRRWEPRSSTSPARVALKGPTWPSSWTRRTSTTSSPPTVISCRYSEVLKSKAAIINLLHGYYRIYQLGGTEAQVETKSDVVRIKIATFSTVPVDQNLILPR